MFYDKKIKYLDYYEKGERMKGCGFAKIEARDEELRIELTVSGLYPTDTFSREVMLCSERQEKQLAQLELFQGRGELKRIYHSRSDVGGTGIPYWELCGICIHLGGEREISCRWQKSENKPAELLFKKAAEHSLQAAAATTAGPGSWAEPERGGLPERMPQIKAMPLDDSAGEEFDRERATGRETAGRGNMGNEADREGATGRESTGRGNMGNEADRERATGRESTGRGNTGNEADREGSTGRESAGRGNTGNEADWERSTGRESAGRGNTGNEAERERSTGRESTGRGITGNEADRERATGRESAGRGNIGNEAERERKGSVKREYTGKEPAREERRQPRMLDDKWLQLCAIYPHVQPFRDERDYLSIKPADFLLFPANAYRQVNNSFLLHGYYNYKHLLLSRVERKGEILYYVGVPGNYYEKEKQVALMFGFESFECAEEPAENGDFGYYMMRMEL